MMMRSLGPGPLRYSPSSNPGGTGVLLLVLELGELDRLNRVGVGHGVKLGLLRRVRTVNVTTPFFSCCFLREIIIVNISDIKCNIFYIPLSAFYMASAVRKMTKDFTLKV